MKKFSIRDTHHTLVAVAAVRMDCFAEDIVAASVEVEAGCTVEVEAGCIVAVVVVDIAAAEAEAGCIAAFAAGVVVDCTDLDVWAVLWKNRCGCVHRYFVPPNVVEPKGPVGFLRGRVLAVQDWATKS